jgi:hypothetical protein
MNTSLKNLRSMYVLAMIAASVGFAGCSGSHDIMPATSATTQSARQNLSSSAPSARPDTVGQNYTMIVPLSAHISQGTLTLNPAPAPRTGLCSGVNANSGATVNVATNTIAVLSGYNVTNFTCNGLTPTGTPARYVIVMVTNPGNSPVDAAAMPITLPGVQRGHTITFGPNQTSITIPANTPTHFFVAYF